MNSRDRLVLLADKLDAKGFASEASVLDEIIVKRSFDEDTRTNLRSVVESINHLVEELSEATKGQRAQNKTTGEWFIQGGLDPDKQDFFNERLEGIQQAVGYIGDLNAELDEDTPWPEEDSGDEKQAEEGSEEDLDDEPAEEPGGEREPWWERFKGKFRGTPDEGDDAGGFDPEADRPPEDETTLPNPSPDRDTDDELQEEEFDSDTGTVKRTRGRGVAVEQSMSNIGNVNIGE